MSEPLLGAVEGGGTKFVCAVGYRAEHPLERIVLPTAEPRSILREVFDFFTEAQRKHGDIRAFGIASFGPLDLRESSPSFGRLMATPKTAWSRTDLMGAFIRHFAVPVAIETDVTAAAMAELTFGAGRDVHSLAYVTIGTGIGGGFAPAMWNGARLLHPEMGHLRVERHPQDLTFPGGCPFHADCLEGLANGPAVQARWGRQLCDLEEDHPAWPILGSYLGQLAASIALVASPQRLVFGGGLASDGRLLPHIRHAVRNILNGYLEPLNVEGALERYICMPVLADSAGLVELFYWRRRLESVDSFRRRGVRVRRQTDRRSSEQCCCRGNKGRRDHAEWRRPDRRARRNRRHPRKRRNAW